MTLIKSISGFRGTIGGKPDNGLTPIDIVKLTSSFVCLISSNRLYSFAINVIKKSFIYFGTYTKMY